MTQGCIYDTHCWHCGVLSARRLEFTNTVLFAYVSIQWYQSAVFHLLCSSSFVCVCPRLRSHKASANLPFPFPLPPYLYTKHIGLEFSLLYKTSFGRPHPFNTNTLPKGRRTPSLLPKIRGLRQVFKFGGRSRFALRTFWIQLPAIF